MSTKIRAGNAYQRRLSDAARDLGFDWAGFNGGHHLKFVRGPFVVVAASTPKSTDTAFKRAVPKLRNTAAKAAAREAV